jgi:hypothetical protein
MPAVPTEYCYTPDFHELVKKKKSIGNIGFRFVLLETAMLVVAVMLMFHQGMWGGSEYGRLSFGDCCAIHCFTFASMHASVFVAADSPPSYAVNITLPH